MKCLETGSVRSGGELLALEEWLLVELSMEVVLMELLAR